MEYLDILDENVNLTKNQKGRNLAHIDWRKIYYENLFWTFKRS